MNILFICDEYPPGPNGGIGSSVQTLARQLSYSGHKVIVAGLYSHAYGQANVENDQGVLVFRKRYGIKLPVKPGSRVYNLRHKLPNVLKRLLNGQTAFKAFTRFVYSLIDSEAIDVIEIADYNNFCEHLGYVVRWPAFTAPLILKSHGSHSYFCRELQLKPKRLLENTDRLLFERADAVSAVSHYTAAVNQVIFGRSENSVLYNGLSFSTALPADRRHAQTVVFSGSISSKKGIYQLVKAWNEVNVTHPEAVLEIYGKGRTNKVIALLSRQAFAKVSFKGHVGRDTLMNVLAKASLAVYPSFSETFGLAAVEAMAMGCPVIYTNLSCGPEIVEDGKTGLLVNPNDSKAIADKICQILENPAMAEQLGMLAAKTVRERFNIEKIAQEHIMFYQNVISKFS